MNTRAEELALAAVQDAMNKPNVEGESEIGSEQPYWVADVDVVGKGKLYEVRGPGETGTSLYFDRRYAEALCVQFNAAYRAGANSRSPSPKEPDIAKAVAEMEAVSEYQRDLGRFGSDRASVEAALNASMEEALDQIDWWLHAHRWIDFDPRVLTYRVRQLLNSRSPSPQESELREAAEWVVKDIRCEFSDAELATVETLIGAWLQRLEAALSKEGNRNGEKEGEE